MHVPDAWRPEQLQVQLGEKKKTKKNTLQLPVGTQGGTTLKQHHHVNTVLPVGNKLLL